MPDLWDFIDDRDYSKTEKIKIDERDFERFEKFLDKAKADTREVFKPVNSTDLNERDLLNEIDTNPFFTGMNSTKKRELSEEIRGLCREKNINDIPPEIVIDVWGRHCSDLRDLYKRFIADLQIWYSQNFEEQNDQLFENDILNEDLTPKDEKKDTPEPEQDNQTRIEAPGGVSETFLGVELPSQKNNLEGLEIEHQIEVPNIEPLQKQKFDIFSKDDWSLKNVLAQKMEILKNPSLEIRSFVQKRNVKENTKIAYQDAGRRVSKVLGETPTQEQALKYLLKSALYDTDGTYHLNKAGVRELYNDTYNSMRMVLPKQFERDKMKLNHRRSGIKIDIPDSRPMVKARTEELDPDKMNRIIEALPRQWHKDGVLLLDVVGCRRCELPSLTMKLTGRDCLEFEYVVSKQKDGKERTHKIKIHKKNFPQEFAELGKILISRNGAPSLRQSGFEKVKIFTEKQKPKALEEAFRNARNRLGYDPELYKLHSERHQSFTDMRKSGLDDLEIQKRSGHKELKNVLIYGIR